MFIKEINASNMKNLRLDSQEFVKLFKEKKAVLVDVRDEDEQKAWGFSFAINIPASKLPENLDNLPKNKIIITACPHKDRSNASAMYLRSEGFDARYLSDGLIGLAEYLRGERAKDVLS